MGAVNYLIGAEEVLKINEKMEAREVIINRQADWASGGTDAEERRLEVEIISSSNSRHTQQ